MTLSMTTHTATTILHKILERFPHPDETLAEMTEVWETKATSTLIPIAASNIASLLNTIGIHSSLARAFQYCDWDAETVEEQQEYLRLMFFLPGAEPFPGQPSLFSNDSSLVSFCGFLWIVSQSEKDYDGPVCAICGATVSKREEWHGAFECCPSPVESNVNFCCVLGKEIGCKRGKELVSVASLIDGLQLSLGLPQLDLKKSRDIERAICQLVPCSELVPASVMGIVTPSKRMCVLMMCLTKRRENTNNVFPFVPKFLCRRMFAFMQEERCRYTLVSASVGCDVLSELIEDAKIPMY